VAPFESNRLLGLAPAGDGGAMTDVLPTVLLVVGVVMIGIVLTISIRGKIARRQASTPPIRERLEAIKQTAQASDGAHAAAARLHDTARHLAAQIDNRAERLEQLIEQADRRLADLAAATAEPATPPASSPPTGGPHSEPPPIDDLEIPEPSTPGLAPVAVPSAPDPLTAAVYRLADDGHDVVSIAQTLDEQIGKVELILALRE
jgi:hypothetical protein